MARCVICDKDKAGRACLVSKRLICNVCCANNRNEKFGCVDECRYYKYSRKSDNEKNSNLSVRAFAEEYKDIMVEIERIFIDLAEKDESMTDKDIFKAVEVLIDIYNQSHCGKIGGKTGLIVYSIVSAIDHLTELNMPKTSDREIADCLRRIAVSIKFQGGRVGSSTGYIEFVKKVLS